MRAVLTALALVLAAPQALAEAEVRAVTLSTAGLALVEADAPLGDAPLRLRLRRADIDDFLKSFWLEDPLAVPARLSLTGDGGFEDSFALLPLAPTDVTDTARLLGAMVGAPLAVEQGRRSATGLNMGVATRDCEGGPCPVLAVQGEDGTVHQFALGDGLQFRFLDAGDRNLVARSLEAYRRHGTPGVIEVMIGTDAPEARLGRLAWLQAAPLWRTAYRAVDSADGVRLVGWAIVENATGMDWNGVELTLATGAVRAIEAQLYARRTVRREQADGVVEPMLAASELLLRRTAEAPAPAPVAVDTETDDGDSFSRFTLSDPVHLGAGEMLSLPFLSETLSEARLLLYRGQQRARHPMLALEIENPLPLRLPAGVLTLYEEGRGHAGDAMIPELAPQGRAVVEFARDMAVSVREESRHVERVREMRLVSGILTVSEDLERRVIYHVEGAPDRARGLTIEHPRRSGWELLHPAAARETLDAWRFQLDLAAGELASFEVVERQPRERRVALLDLDTAALAQWVRLAPDAASRELLTTLQGIRRQEADAVNRIQRLREREGALVAEQARLLEVIVALGAEAASNAGRRARVDAIDGEIATVREERTALEDMREQLSRQVTELLGG